jgi:hypothetical protein
MPAPLVAGAVIAGEAVEIAEVAAAARLARPALAALVRLFNQLRPAVVQLGEMLARSAGGFKELVVKAFTVENAMAGINKAMSFVSVADAAGKLAVALAGVKGKFAEAATGFGLFGKPKAEEKAAAAAAGPAAQQVAAAAGDCDCGSGESGIEEVGKKAEEAAPKVGFLQEQLARLKGEFTWDKVVETASSYDQLKLSLEGVLGSTESAGQAFRMIQDFAARTPVSVESATTAFEQLWKAGIKPTSENLTAFGNVAGAFNKDVTAVTSAIAGVDLGNLDGLKELGFKVEEQGNKLKISFQGITTTVGNSSRDVAGYLEKLGNTRFADGMERQASTFATGFDSVKEAFANLRNAIGEKGLLTSLESMDVSFAKIINRAQPIADVIGKGLGGAMKIAADAVKVLADHAEIVIPLVTGIAAAASTPSLGQLAGGLAAARTAVIALGEAIIANPIGLIVGAIAAVVAALVIFKDKTLTIGETSATVGEWLQATWDVTKEYLSVAWEAISTEFARLAKDFGILWGWIKDFVADGVKSFVAWLGRGFEYVANFVRGIGEFLGVGFGAILGFLRDVANKALAVIFSIPEAFSAARQALEEGDVSGLFDRVRSATADNFKRDYVGETFNFVVGGISDFANRVGEAVGAVAGKVKDWVVGIGKDFADLGQMFGTDVVARVREVVASRPPKPKELTPPTGGGSPKGGGATDAVSYQNAVDEALRRVQESAAGAKAALETLQNAAPSEVKKKYEEFVQAAQKAQGVLKEQKSLLEQLPKKNEAVAKALESVAQAQAELNHQMSAANTIRMAESLKAVETATAETNKALAELNAASVADVYGEIKEFNEVAKKATGTIGDAAKELEGLTDAEGEVAKASQKVKAATDAVRASQEAASKVLGKFSEESLGAAKALDDLKNASPGEGPAKAEAYRTQMEKLRATILLAGAALHTLAPGPEYNEALKKLQQMQGEFKTLGEEGEKWGAGLAQTTIDATDTMTKHFDGFVDGVSKAFDSALTDLFKGSTDGFEKLFDGIADLFAEMLSKMVADWIKSKIFQQGVSTGGGFSFSGFSQNFGQGQYGNAAALGAGIGAYGSRALGGSADTGALIGTAASLAGQAIGLYITQGAAYGGFWGAVIGAVVGALIAAYASQKPDIKGYATLEVNKGFAVIESFRAQGKADAAQLQKYAKGVADAINEIVYLSGGALTSLGKITLQTKDNKYYRVIDASGITHKFGEDLKAATDYAVLQALKGAQLDGLSPEVQAAFRNTLASTVEELAADIEFAAMVRDLDLEPVTKDVRNLMKTFNEMRERARSLGISLDKVDDAFNEAVENMKKNILSGLKPFQEAGLTDVEREARRITEAFEEMRENARLFNEELERQKGSRNEEIQKLQGDLAHQQELLAQAQQHPEDFIPQDVLDRLAARGLDTPERLQRLATSGIEEMIKKLVEEIARLQGLNESQTPIDTSEIDRAEQEARRALRERVRDSLKPYQHLDLTSVQQQLRELDDTFEKLRRDAHAAGVASSEVDEAYRKAREAIRKQVMEQLQPYLDMAEGLTPLQVALRDLDDKFEEMRTNAAELGIDMETVNRAEQAAREQLRQQFEDDLKAFGGENPFVAQLDELKKKFEELRKNAIALGESTDRVDAAYRQALANLQKQFQDGIQSYLDYGRGLSEVAVRYRDLTRFFDEQREAARALDEAQGFHGGGGPNEQLLGEAQAAAFQQLVDEFKASLQDLRDAGLTPTEIAVRQMHDRFAQLREDAELLGLSVDELSRLEQQAIERLRGELDAQLDRYLLSDEEQQQKSLQDEFLGYLRDAFALYTYEPGTQEEPEPFPGARALEQTFGDVKTASQELAQAFRDLRFAMQPGGTTPPPPTGPGLYDDTELTPGEMVAQVLDFLKPLYEGRGMDDVPAEQRQAIDAASTQVALLLEQLRLGMTDDVTGLQGALGNLVTLLQQSGIDIDGSLLALTQALGSGDIAGFLDELRDGVLGSTDGFGALIDILLSGGDLSLPDLMHQLASGTFDAIQAMLGLTEIPPELAETLKRIGLAYEAAQNQQHAARQVERGGGDDANREAEQRQRDLDALLRQLEQFEDLQLSPAERELKKLNEQFDEMRDNAARLGVSLDRVESAYQLAIADFWERLLGPLNDFLESLSLSELSTLTPQQRLDEAQARFQDLATRAMGGDLEAAQQLQAAAQQYLQEAQSFYASGQGYQDIFAMVNSVIQQILGTLAPGLLPTPPIPPAASDFAAMLADTGWSFRDALTTAGIPFGTFAGDTYGGEPGEAPAWLGAEGRPELAVDLTGMRDTNRALLEEVRLAREQEHVDAVELQRRVDEQGEEMREVRALLRRLTSNTQYGGRAQ